MKKILTSVVVLTALVAAVYVGTEALFSDTETSTGNTFTTGTIDIAVDEENPWVKDYDWQLNDMKPSYTGYMYFEVENVGSNPLNLYKTLKNFSYPEDTAKNEPECDAEDGTWDNGVCSDPTNEKQNIDSVINYDMRVELYMPNVDEPVWWETIYTDADDFKMADLVNDKMYLGMVPANWTMKVIQSYHMVDAAGNKYQDDAMEFDVELYAEQLNADVRLVNKYEADTDVSHHVWGGPYADFGYKIKDDELRWTLDTTDVPNGDYTLLVWDDSDTSTDGTKYNWNWNERSEAIVLAHLTDPGTGTYNDDIDLGHDLINAKVWLVPGTHGAVGGGAGNFGWDATGTFFETGLIDYYDSL